MPKFKNHKSFAKAPERPATDRFPFVCFACRKSFKYPPVPDQRVCPQCRGPLERLSRKFSAPKSKDLMQWRKVQYLVEHGFRFDRVFVPVAPGVQRSVDYPRTLQEAKAFVEYVRAHRGPPQPISINHRRWSRARQC
jgi:hypothetical protein